MCVEMKRGVACIVPVIPRELRQRQVPTCRVVLQVDQGHYHLVVRVSRFVSFAQPDTPKKNPWFVPRMRRLQKALQLIPKDNQNVSYKCHNNYLFAPRIASEKVILLLYAPTAEQAALSFPTRPSSREIRNSNYSGLAMARKLAQKIFPSRPADPPMGCRPARKQDGRRRGARFESLSCRCDWMICRAAPPVLCPERIRVWQESPDHPCIRDEFAATAIAKPWSGKPR